MEIEKLTEILSEESGNKFCVICGTPFTPRSKRQKTCGAKECQRLFHNEYMKKRKERMKAQDLELWRKYHREAEKKRRDNKRRRIMRDAELKKIEERWRKQAEFDKKVSEYGHRYGEVQAQKILATVPKIDVNLGGEKHDNVHDKDSGK